MEDITSQIPLYPFRFEPIYQYRSWGGWHLANLLAAPLPEDDPIGEAWILSDRDDHASLVANGPLKGQTIKQLFKLWPDQLLGKQAKHFERFPLLLKFLDAREMLSLQVHPSDNQTDYIPKGEHGKTEAWIVLETGPESLIYKGLKQDTTADNMRQALIDGTVPEYLTCFKPKPGDAVFLPSGTVHALGNDMVVFEIQQNSDVTFRLFDWNHVDTKTGKPRPLQIDKALACIDFSQGAIGAVTPEIEAKKPVLREKLFHCQHFSLWRLQGQVPFTVGALDVARVLVCIKGNGKVEYCGTSFDIRKGEVLLLPAVAGICTFHPESKVTLLEIALPE